MNLKKMPAAKEAAEVVAKKKFKKKFPPKK